MKKIILSLLILFTITNLHADKVERDKNDPLQNLQIGDKFTISKTSTDTETTFDFTGLGLSDNPYLLDKIALEVSYYKDNNVETVKSFSTIIFINKDNINWSFYYDKNEYIENITSSYFKQTIKHTDTNKDKLTSNVGRVSVFISYYPEGIKKYNHYYIYSLKALNNGSGEIEVVGYMSCTPDGASESKGDVYRDLPL